MPVINVHCAGCGSEFVDSRTELVEGDEAICPKCGTRNAFASAIAEATRRESASIDSEAKVAHSEAEVVKRRSSHG
jgi:predicted  nucleic acid-binding Zn-ribbon protein